MSAASVTSGPASLVTFLLICLLRLLWLTGAGEVWPNDLWTNTEEVGVVSLKQDKSKYGDDGMYIYQGKLELDCQSKETVKGYL